ncbi:MAG: HAD family hydrolase, partial [Calditrichaeota bacterium]
MERDGTILLLFDIDGTLTTSEGRAGQLMIRALEELLGQKVTYTRDDFSGSTDRLIIRNLLRRSGKPIEDEDRVIDAVLERYLAYLRQEFLPGGVVRALPGVKSLLEALARDERFALGLVTGNVREGAYTKLRPVGLAEYFPVGAFGDDAMDRNALPPLALARASRYYHTPFDPRRTWIIGDSIRDIACARANGLRA